MAGALQRNLFVRICCGFCCGFVCEFVRFVGWRGENAQQSVEGGTASAVRLMGEAVCDRGLCDRGWRVLRSCDRAIVRSAIVRFCDRAERRESGAGKETQRQAEAVLVRFVCVCWCDALLRACLGGKCAWCVRGADMQKPGHERERSKRAAKERGKEQKGCAHRLLRWTKACKFRRISGVRGFYVLNFLCVFLFCCNCCNFNLGHEPATWRTILIKSEIHDTQVDPRGMSERLWRLSDIRPSVR